MPKSRIVLSDWDIQELFRGYPVKLSGEVRPDEITLDINPAHLNSIKSTIAALIQKQKIQEGG